MKIGDKVKVTYTNGDQCIGRIVKETEKTWLVDFDGAKTKRVKKSANVVLVDDPKTPEKEVVSIPASVIKYSKKQSRGMKWRVGIWIIVALALATVAVLGFMGIIPLGAG